MKVKFLPSEEYETRRSGIPSRIIKANGTEVAGDHVTSWMFNPFCAPCRRIAGGICGCSKIRLDVCSVKKPNGAKMIALKCPPARLSRRIESPVDGVGLVLWFGGESATKLPIVDATTASASDAWGKEMVGNMAMGEARVYFVGNENRN